MARAGQIFRRTPAGVSQAEDTNHEHQDEAGTLDNPGGARTTASPIDVIHPRRTWGRTLDANFWVTLYRGVSTLSPPPLLAPKICCSAELDLTNHPDQQLFSCLFSIIPLTRREKEREVRAATAS